MNQTIFHYADLTHNTLESATSSVAVLDEQFKESIVLVVLQPPPLQVGIREPFSVIVQVATEHGLPVPGAQVVVTLIAPKHSNVRLSGEMRAISDSTGKATLSLHFPSGRSGLYSLLISCDSVIEHLLTPGGIGSEVAKQAAKAQRAVLGSDIVLSTFAARVEGLQSIANSTLHFAARARLEMQMQATAQLAADDSANCIGFVPLPWWGASPILVDNTIGTEATQACIDTKMQSRLDGLRSAATTPVDRLTMYKILRPMLLEMLLAAANTIPILTTALSATTLPLNYEELTAKALVAALAAWEKLPLPPPLAVYLSNGLDADPNPNVTDASSTRRNGVNLTAPIIGYALSESSESTNVVSGMSNCALEGYARVEPSPRSPAYVLQTGLMEPSWPNMPDYMTGKASEDASTYYRSALWQPFPFQSFNFLFDSLVTTPDTGDTTNCRRTYMTKGSSFPMFIDPSFNLTTTCSGFDMKCTLNVPDNTANEGGQTTDSPCKPEFTRMFGPDSMPSRSMLPFGGFVALAKHLECLGCYESVMGNECSTGIFELDLTPEFDPFSTSTKFHLGLSADVCAHFFTRLADAPDTTLASAWEEFTLLKLSKRLNLANVTSSAALAWQSSAALRRLKQLVNQSGWNGCYSKRYQFDEASKNATGPDINKYDPKVKLEMRVHGTASTDYSAFGGVSPLVQLRDKNPSGEWQWTELKFNTILLNIGGEWRTYQTEVISGGSRRELDLELLVDGVPAGHASDSWWRFDNLIEYVNPEVVSLKMINVLFLSGHDGFRVFAVLTIPIFYLNVRGRRARMPGLFGCVVGGTFVFLFVWYQGTVLRIGSLRGTPDLFQLPPPLAHKVNPILAFGKNDIVAIMRWDDMTNMQRIITAFLIVFISGPFCISFMYLSLRWLIGEFVRPAFPKEIQRMSERLAMLSQKPEDVDQKIVVKRISRLSRRSKRSSESSMHTSSMLPRSFTSKSFASFETSVDSSEVAGVSWMQANRASIFNGRNTVLAPLRADAFSGSPEIAEWLESDFVLRHRCARNHVRILLRSRLWYEAQLLKLAQKSKRPGFCRRLLCFLFRKNAPQDPSPRNEPFPRSPPASPPEASSAVETCESNNEVSQEQIRAAKEAQARWLLGQMEDEIDDWSHDQKLHARSNGAAELVTSAAASCPTPGAPALTSSPTSPLLSPLRLFRQMPGAVQSSETHPAQKKTVQEINKEFVKNRRLPLESSESFFFPQRLKMACLLSVWISGALSLIVANLATWVYNIIMTAGILDETLRSHTPVSDQMSAATQLADGPIALLTTLSLFGIQATPSTSNQFGLGSSVYSDVTLAVPYIGVGVLVMTFLLQWYFIFQSFRSDSYALRSGNYFFQKEVFPEDFANRYIGFQVAHMTVSTTIIFIFFAILSMVITPIILSGFDAINDQRALFHSTLWFLYGLILPRSWNNLGILIPMLGSLVFQIVMNKYVFFVGTAVNSWLCYPFWYGLFDYNLLYTNALLGLTVCIARITVLFIFFILFIARLDKTTMPGPRGNFSNFDPAYKAYVGMLRLDHRYNNPVFLTFGDIMLDVLGATRIRTVLRRVNRTHLRDGYDRAIAEAQAELDNMRDKQSPEKVEQMKRTEEGQIALEMQMSLEARIRRLFLQKKLSLWARRILYFAADRHRRRCVIVRNRWQLWWRCMQQPSWQRWRQDRRLRAKLDEKLTEHGDIYGEVSLVLPRTQYTWSRFANPILSSAYTDSQIVIMLVRRRPTRAGIILLVQPSRVGCLRIRVEVTTQTGSRAV